MARKSKEKRNASLKGIKTSLSDIVMRAVDGYRNLLGVLQKKEHIPKDFDFYMDVFYEKADLNSYTGRLIYRLERI